MFCHSPAILVILFAPAFSAAAVILDFEALEDVSTNIPNHGLTYSEDGFDIQFVDLHPMSGPNGIFTVGTLHSGYYGSTAIFPGDRGQLVLTAAGGGTFDVTSVDLHEHFFPLSPTLTFVGVPQVGGMVNQTFVADAALGFETFAFSAGFTDLVSLSWTWTDFPANALRVDNLVLNLTVPEPGSMVLVAMALGMLSAARQRIAMNC